MATGAAALLEGFGDVAPGNVLRERYRLVDVIGRGAHGVTYFAEHEFLNHPCVLKILPQRIRDASDSAVQRLRYEARAGFRVNNPHVVRVLDCDVINDVWYFVMEFVDGIDLATLIENGVSLCWQQAAGLAIDSATGLMAIHNAGLLHRDIKPANLLLGADGRLRISDLGVAGMASRRAGGSSSPGAVGTLAYAAPEMLIPGATVDARADLFSLGATLYHAVTGKRPFANESVFATLINTQTRAVEWPEQAPANVPAWFIKTILTLLANDPAQRFASAEALRNHLARPQQQPATVAAPAVSSNGVQPRGLAVLPFENESGEGADDWLGFALADTLARELSRIPGTYVADHEQLRAVLQRPEIAAVGGLNEQLLAAGRVVGAGTIVTGRFRRGQESICFWSDVVRRSMPQPERIGPLQGPLSRMVELQSLLFTRLAQLLQLNPGAAGVGAALPKVALETREKFTRGKQAYLQGDYETAIRLARDVIEEDADFIEALQYLSACSARLGRYEEAGKYHRQITSLAEQRGDKQLLVEAKANMGVMYYLKGEYEQAQRLYTEAAVIAEGLGLEAERAQIYNNAGFALARLGRSEEAEAAFRRAVDVCKGFGALAPLIGPYNGLGNLLLDQQRYAEARDYYQRALTLAQEIGDRTNTGISHMHLGRCASLEGQFASAKNEFALALNTLEGTSFWNARTITYEYMAEMNLRLGDYAEAVRCAEKKIELARRHANRTMEAAAWRQKAEALRLSGRAREADECLLQARAAQPTGSQPADSGATEPA
ncbi:MAG: tetratricopeptide repeat protein [Phycisphaerae bacterium]|jgi:tetratricopeptide (TPR) repeat protein/tRNA A-37 threonylcarbamoyl transferase component Bud32/TolB-like protein|nr:tetratricopeptide repeat protein [Phycisphaerae bacterium]HOO16867.1 tetratricopeptide repeat protein [Phycisphaerae bacterium]HPC21871.1 tetratricopeptide repeat protein [Phycisphaerae bacterium]HRS27971.1 tetratricopeptide repeat protein [Phycisphaerae bacterium]HRT41384.1 tetratricopeptide repeat protein [Phycisphaerae bacterium]